MNFIKLKNSINFKKFKAEFFKIIKFKAEFFGISKNS